MKGDLNIKTAYIRIFLISVLTMISFVACSGSGGNSSGNAPVRQVGRFLGSPVSGLQYSTDSGSGETNDKGEFRYQDGEQIRFSVGNIFIGEALGTATISIVDLHKLVLPQTALETHIAINELQDVKNVTPLDKVTNIAIFLQTLDEDGDPDNGITISEKIRELAETSLLDLNQKSLSFSQDFSLRKLISAGRDAGLWGGTRAIQSAGYALDSLYLSLGLSS